MVEKYEDIIFVSGARSGMSAKFAEEVVRETWERELKRIEEERKEPLNADNFEERYREWVAEKFKRLGR